MKNLKYLLALALIALMVACSDDNNDPIVEPEPEFLLPKKELRAVWVSTAWELDWPLGQYDVTAQKKMYTDYLDKFKECNVNAVFVQIRSMADAFYPSAYEPWSKNITGVRGQNPGYDVLQFMIDEAHARDMEFHAWMNPYRIATRPAATKENPDPQFPAMDLSIDESMYMDYSTIRIYNPASPAVQKRIADIVEEVIIKYNVDGIVFDDYFYPPQAVGKLDEADYAQYGDGYATVEDFRRGNVTKAIRNVQERIVAKKPGVVFTLSPASDQTANYNNLYADVTQWCQEGWIDVVMPQLYMSTGGSFKDRVHWWPQFSFKAVPMIAYAMYKFGDPTEKDTKFQSGDELELQFQRAGLEPKILGSSMYTAKSFTDNRIDIVGTVKKIYKDPAARPFLARQTMAEPTAPSGLAISGSTLSWQAAGDLQTIVYVLPYIKDEAGKVVGKSKIATIVAITSQQSVQVDIQGEYLVSTINADNKESSLSNFVEFK